MKTVTLKTLDQKVLKIELKRSGMILGKIGIYENKTIEIIRIFRPDELSQNSNTIIFGQANDDGITLQLDKDNTALLDAAFEELGYTGFEKDLCYMVG